MLSRKKLIEAQRCEKRTSNVDFVLQGNVGIVDYGQGNVQFELCLCRRFSHELSVTFQKERIAGYGEVLRAEPQGQAMKGASRAKYHDLAPVTLGSHSLVISNFRTLLIPLAKSGGSACTSEMDHSR